MDMLFNTVDSFSSVFISQTQPCVNAGDREKPPERSRKGRGSVPGSECRGRGRDACASERGAAVRGARAAPGRRAEEASEPRGRARRAHSRSPRQGEARWTRCHPHARGATGQREPTAASGAPKTAWESAGWGGGRGARVEEAGAFEAPAVRAARPPDGVGAAQRLPHCR